MLDPLTGYLHPAYCASLSQLGEPFFLPNAGSWLLKRSIPGSELADAMGCYPLLCCSDWQALGEDLAHLDPQVICVSAITDPFGSYSAEELQVQFDIARPFKAHFVVDLQQDPASRTSQHHRKELKKAAKTVEVDYCPDPTDLADEWIALYRNLIQKRGIRGMAAFSPTALQQQLSVPGLAAFRAHAAGETVGIALWYRTGENWYYHLTANNDLGYRYGASYPLVAHALDHFARRGYRWANLGAGAGIATDVRQDGLTRFKAGWTTQTRTAYLCGKVLQPIAYRELSQQRVKGNTHYFPAYREGELGAPSS